MLRFVKPTIEYAKEIMNYREEFLSHQDNLSGCTNLEDCLSGEEWVHYVNRCENEATCPEGYVEASTYLVIHECDGQLVGVINFRHRIDTPILREMGGHIGYSVRPSERNKGYGKEMLRMMLPICKETGLTHILIACLEDNIASEKIILANGGIFERTTIHEDTVYKRFWIRLY